MSLYEEQVATGFLSRKSLRKRRTRLKGLAKWKQDGQKEHPCNGLEDMWAAAKIRAVQTPTWLSACVKIRPPSYAGQAQKVPPARRRSRGGDRRSRVYLFGVSREVQTR